MSKCSLRVTVADRQFAEKLGLPHTYGGRVVARAGGWFKLSKMDTSTVALLLKNVDIKPRRSGRKLTNKVLGLARCQPGMGRRRTDA